VTGKAQKSFTVFRDRNSPAGSAYPTPLLRGCFIYSSRLHRLFFLAQLAPIPLDYRRRAVVAVSYSTEPARERRQTSVPPEQLIANPGFLRNEPRSRTWHSSSLGISSFVWGVGSSHINIPHSRPSEICTESPQLAWGSRSCQPFRHVVSETHEHAIHCSSIATPRCVSIYK